MKPNKLHEEHIEKRELMKKLERIVTPSSWTNREISSDAHESYKESRDACRAAGCPDDEVKDG